ncbi:MAG: hypothetical protein AAGB03_12075, partial [Pseudomonadota bacterium]
MRQARKAPGGAGWQNAVSRPGQAHTFRPIPAVTTERKQRGSTTVNSFFESYARAIIRFRFVVVLVML